MRNVTVRRRAIYKEARRLRKNNIQSNIGTGGKLLTRSNFVLVSRDW